MTPQQLLEALTATERAVTADDLLLTALGSATPNAAGALVDDELNALLLAWRHDIEAEPFVLPDGDLLVLGRAL